MILPGSTIGVMGSGQLGRMFTHAAHHLGYRVRTFSPESNTPTGQVADGEVVGFYDDLEAIESFAKSVDVMTFEFENIPARSVECASAIVPVRPGAKALHISQHRDREKTFLSQQGYPTTAYRRINSFEGLKNALSELGTPIILKTAGMGYDGKGQMRIENEDQALKAYATFGSTETIAEAWVDFSTEVSVIGARGVNGEFAHWGLFENHHVKHVLDISIAPSSFPKEISEQAIEITRQLMTDLDMVGLLCVEFFVTKSGKLLVNELAPRPHNSGHLTIDACKTSQFEQQLRAICGLPLGETQLIVPGAAMANLLGDLWANGEPQWDRVATLPKIKLHRYGKKEARPGRKMGHLTALGKSGPEAAQMARTARDQLVATSPARR